MGISRKRRRQIIDLLTPYMLPERRLQIVRGAFWGDSFLERISWEGDAPAFTVKLVNTALMDGPLDDGEHPLPALLEEVRLLMPPGERETVDALLTELRGTPPDEPNWDTLQTKKLETPDDERFEARRTEIDVVESDSRTPTPTWHEEDTLTDVLPDTQEWEEIDTLADGLKRDELAASLEKYEAENEDETTENDADNEDNEGPPDYFEAASLRLAEHDFDGAVDLYRTAIEQKVAPAEAHYQIGRVMEIRKQYDDALAHYEQSLRLLPDERPHTRRGVIFALRGDREAALHEFERATTTDDPDPTAYFYRAMLHFDEGDYDDALTDLDHALDLRPSYASAHRERGVIFTIKQEYTAALQAYSTALVHDPDDAETYYYRANVYALQNDNDAAFADYTTAAERHPDHPQYRYRRGKLAVGMEKYGDAIPDLTTAVELDTTNADAHFLLALCKMKAENAYGEAEALLEKALQLAPGNEEYTAAMKIARGGTTDA